MQITKLLKNLCFLLTIISLPVSFTLSAIVGDVEVFGVMGIIRYSWIMLLFVPFCVLSLIIGKREMAYEQTYKILFFAALICLPLLLIFGSYRLIFQEVSYDAGEIHAIEEKIDVDLPNRIKAATLDFEDYTISYAKIMDRNEAAAFAQEIQSNALWTSELSTAINGLLPLEIQAEMANFDYFVFLNLSTGVYNEYLTTEEANCVLVAYDQELQRLILLDDYVAKAVL